MTKPDDIPQDVWDAADAVLDQGTAALRDYILGGGDAPDVGILKPFIAHAIMAERDACAVLADEWKNTDAGLFAHGANFAANELSAAIRNRGAAAPDVPPLDAA